MSTTEYYSNSFTRVTYNFYVYECCVYTIRATLFPVSENNYDNTYGG